MSLDENSKAILEETLTNLERIESEVRQVKRRIREHIENEEDDGA
jgi:hypothetical protein